MITTEDIISIKALIIKAKKEAFSLGYLTGVLSVSFILLILSIIR